MKVVRRHGAVQLRLDRLEAAVLTGLFGELLVALTPGGTGGLAADDPVRQRLYPAGYRDDDVAAEDFRELTEAGLTTERTQRLQQCLDELSSRDDANGEAIGLDADAAQRWIRVLNDVRLAVGTRLGVSEDEPAGVDPDDPSAPQWAAYYWLTGLQDALVRVLMR